MSLSLQKRVGRLDFHLARLPIVAAMLVFLVSACPAQETPYLGEIQMFAGTFAPKGWALCNGQILSISQNQALFSLLGTTYGGDGRTTFALPNLQVRIPIHQGNFYTLGQTGGQASVTMNASQIPAHTHSIPALVTDSTAATTDQAKGALPSRNPAAIPSYGTTANTTLNPSAATVGSTGGATAVPTMPPVQTVNFIISLTGIFPTQN